MGVRNSVRDTAGVRATQCHDAVTTKEERCQHSSSAAATSEFAAVATTIATTLAASAERAPTTVASPPTPRHGASENEVIRLEMSAKVVSSELSEWEEHLRGKATEEAAMHVKLESDRMKAQLGKFCVDAEMSMSRLQEMAKWKESVGLTSRHRIPSAPHGDSCAGCRRR